MKIIFFETEPWECEPCQILKNEHEFKMTDERPAEDNAGQYADADIISPFIYSDLSADVLAKFSNLKLIATRSAGIDHIDIGYCKKKGITVCNVPAYGDNTVAEHVFGLLLTISHRLVDAVDRTRKGDFSLKGLEGFDLCDKTLGVIGTGNIGRCVIKIAKGFSMNVVAYDVKPDEEFASHLDFHYVGMDELLNKSDVITLHVPATKATHHLLSTEQFEKMKDGVIIINTARGTLIDIQALLHAISEGKVAAAGLDVLPEEPTVREEAELLRSIYQKKHNMETLLANHVLLRLRNVFITPHSAFYTREAVQKILYTTLDNIGSFIEGNPKNVCT
ncbi:MAG: hydroxyacid dehydrogenase [Nitrospirae bacterium]|nr:hydroxyacid dehydrogenase [Nitrospirota bacterium]